MAALAVRPGMAKAKAQCLNATATDQALPGSRRPARRLLLCACAAGIEKLSNHRMFSLIDKWQQWRVITNDTHTSQILSTLEQRKMKEQGQAIRRSFWRPEPRHAQD